MARTEHHTSASPDAVWAVLANPDAYADWVVGSKDIRAADPGFPAPGTRFHHTVGVGPVSIDDHSEVLDATPPRHLRLEVRARPAGRARVDLRISPTSDGSRIEMVETPISLIARLGHNPLADAALHGRNVEALRRLGLLAEGARPIPETSRRAGEGAA